MFKLLNWQWSATTTTFTIRHWYMLLVACVSITHQFLPVLTSYSQKSSKVWPFSCEKMVALYHRFLYIHLQHCTSMSNLKWLFFLVIHDNPTRWITTWRTKGVITLFNYSICKLGCHSSVIIVEFYCLSNLNWICGDSKTLLKTY